MSDDGKLNRREFLWRAGMIGAAAAGGSTLLSGCKKGGGGAEKKEAPEKSAGTTDEKKAAQKEKAGGEFSCTDTSGLSESEIKTRESLKYVDRTEKPDKN